MTRTTASLLVAALVLLAGCAGGTGLGNGGPTTTATDTDAQSTDTPATDDSGSTTGTLDFYVSDRPNAIGDFEHLNVTIDRVVLIRSAGGDDPENETDGPDETGAEDDETPTATVTASGTTTATATGNETSDNGAVTATPTVTETPTPTEEPEEAEERDEAEKEDEAESEGRVVLDPSDRTVDLTRLVGNNATLIGTFDVPAGEYEKVFLHVSEIDATLDTGESANVKLPSEKLHVTKPFTVSANASTDFVFDIAVHKAGKSGKYILRPVISESGTDVPIESVEDENERPEKAERENENRSEQSEDRDGRSDDADEARSPADLEAAFVGNVTAGENATVEVTSNGSAVANATVTVNGEVVGTTDADGRLTFRVPTDAEELAVEVEAGEAEAELEVEFESEGGERPEEAGSGNESAANAGKAA